MSGRATAATGAIAGDAAGAPDDVADVDALDADGAVEAVTPADVEALLDRIRMRGIRLVRWSGEAPPGGEGTVERVDARLEPARMRVQPGELSLWFEHRVECENAVGATVATIKTGVVVEFDVQGDDEPELAVVACFADTNAAFMAWPYIREAVQAMSMRLGLAPITLGILRRDSDAYSDQDRP